MSANYAKVKSYYKSGRWSAERVYNAVAQGWITGDEYAEITGTTYIAPETADNSEEEETTVAED
ncbi:MAG: XkdX family protein [Oscillospiraceae bacterium]|nr:XkdX family protein [Oscillospiraceae bacterium]